MRSRGETGPRARAEERYRAFVENSSEAIWCYEASEPIPTNLSEDEQIDAIYRYGVLSECNEAMARMYGLESREQLIGARLADLLVPTDPNNIDLLRAFIRSGYRLVDAESHEQTPAGEMGIFLNNMIGVVEDGMLVRAWGTQRDVTEQRRAGEMLQAVIHASPLAILTLDPDGIVTGWNPAAERMFGWARQEVIGRPMPFVPAGKQAESRALRERVLRGDAFADVVVERRRKDGSRIDLSLSTAPLRDATGAIRGIMGVMADVTEQRRARQALRESEERYRLLFDANPHPMWVYDRESLQFLAVNDAAVRQYGYSRDEFLSMTIKDIRPPGDARALPRGVAQSTEEPQQVGVWRHRRKDGTLLDVEITTHGLEFAGRRAIMALVMEVTERVRYEEERRLAQEALRESEAALRALVDNAVFGIYRSSIDGRLLMANQTLATMLGYGSVEELLRVDLATDVYQDPAERARLVGRYGEQDRVDEVEVGWKKKGGSPITVRLSGRPVRDAQGAVRAFEMIVHDVTDRLQLERQLQQAQKMESLGQLAGGMAHDFNNLLTTILSSTELLAGELPADSPLRTDVDVVHRAAERAAELTSRLLAFGRRQQLEMQTVNLGERAAEFTRMVRRMLPADIEIAMRLEGPETAIRAAPGAIEQILMNLVTNARDAMPSGGAVMIEVTERAVGEEFCRAHGLWAPGTYALLSVSDTGTGMDHGTLGHLFEPFFTTKPVGKGTGLGMAMIYGLVKQHDGLVQVHSEPNHGTTVTVLFPALASQARTGVAVAPQGTIQGGTEMILLAEDEESLRQTAARVLRKSGYQVIVAADGAEALDMYLARESDIQLIVTDVVMPRLGGPQLLEELRRLGKRPKIIFTSGYTARDVQESKALEPGLPFVSKPWTITELLTRVREVLDRPTVA